MCEVRARKYVRTTSIRRKKNLHGLLAKMKCAVPIDCHFMHACFILQFDVRRAEKFFWMQLGEEKHLESQKTFCWNKNWFCAPVYIDTSWDKACQQLNWLKQLVVSSHKLYSVPSEPRRWSTFQCAQLAHNHLYSCEWPLLISGETPTFYWWHFWSVHSDSVSGKIDFGAL